MASPLQENTPSSSTTSDPRYTPVSNPSDEEGVQSGSRRPPVGSLKLQTDFGDSSKDAESAGSSGSNDGDIGYDSDGKLQQAPNRPGHSAQYTPAEEGQVIQKFDRKLVPFLAFLYLLSFLDRSSMSMTWVGIRAIC